MLKNIIKKNPNKKYCTFIILRFKMLVKKVGNFKKCWDEYYQAKEGILFYTICFQ